MGKRETKSKHKRQVVLVIVEGQTDANVLYVPLTEAFLQKYGPDAIVLFAKIQNDNGKSGGDITSRHGVVPEKLHMLMNKLIILPCLVENSLMPKYITEIVQIIDTDGAYIPDDCIMKNGCDDPLNSLVYNSESILAVDPARIIERNARKRNNIQALLGFQQDGFDIQNFCDTGFGNKPTTKAFHVPYSLYYFSCNLDHFIGGTPNLDLRSKISNADTFVLRYSNDLYSFIKYLQDDTAAIKEMSYEESWELLKTDCNSLKRMTNISLLFNLLINVSDFNTVPPYNNCWDD